MRIVKLTEETRKDILENLLKRSPDSYGEYEKRVADIFPLGGPAAVGGGSGPV